MLIVDLEFEGGEVVGDFDRKKVLPAGLLHEFLPRIFLRFQLLNDKLH